MSDVVWYGRVLSGGVWWCLVVSGDKDILLTIWLGPLEGVSLDPSSALTFVFGTSKYVGPSLKMSSFVVEVSGLIVLVVVATRYVGLSLTILFVLIKIRDVEVEVVATSE